VGFPVAVRVAAVLVNGPHQKLVIPLSRSCPQIPAAWLAWRATGASAGLAPVRCDQG